MVVVAARVYFHRSSTKCDAVAIGDPASGISKHAESQTIMDDAEFTNHHPSQRITAHHNRTPDRLQLRLRVWSVFPSPVLSLSRSLPTTPAPVDSDGVSGPSRHYSYTPTPRHGCDGFQLTVIARPGGRWSLVVTRRCPCIVGASRWIGGWCCGGVGSGRAGGEGFRLRILMLMEVGGGRWEVGGGGGERAFRGNSMAGTCAFEEG
ncbi:hypothetical protein EX30DRAFT_387106 [Ascodesmis nigricans]|uniref:Uncharacterized protein n=1 Tax=Ascodesmis nigricans TaxID=341454 RepID=A0A4S2MKR2_9PEZI|nr:hypothetical protein EX30DRAFT_387106 [Ascodesmis nigricans]